METRGKSSPAKPMAPMAPSKASKGRGWEAAKANHLAKGNAMLEHANESNPDLSVVWGGDWEKVPENCINETTIYEYLGTFLASVYVIAAGHRNGGEHLDQETAEKIWSGILDHDKKRLKQSKNPKTKVSLLHTYSRAFICCHVHLCWVKHA